MTIASVISEKKVVLLVALGLFVAPLVTLVLITRGGSSFNIEDARGAVRSGLRDPNSAQFHDEVVIGNANSRTVCGNVNAKNGFGGYTGKSAFIYDEQSKLAKVASGSDDAHSIMQSCRLAKIKELEEEIVRRCSLTPAEPACNRRK